MRNDINYIKIYIIQTNPDFNNKKNLINTSILLCKDLIKGYMNIHIILMHILDLRLKAIRFHNLTQDMEHLIH